MANRKRHTDKHVEAAVREAEANGWRVEERNGHCWALLLAPNGVDKFSVYSTPARPEAHAKDILRAVAREAKRR